MFGTGVMVGLIIKHHISIAEVVDNRIIDSLVAFEILGVAAMGAILLPESFHEGVNTAIEGINPFDIDYADD